MTEDNRCHERLIVKCEVDNRVITLTGKCSSSLTRGQKVHKSDQAHRGYTLGHLNWIGQFQQHDIFVDILSIA